jgi:hypothetical protein
MTTRLVSFANSTITVTYHGDLPAQIVDFLYRHIPVIPNASSPTLTYHLRSDEPDLLTLQRGDTLLYRGHSAAAAAELLLGDSGQALAASSRGGLLFHAAGLSGSGRGLLLSGPTGCGKSTLAAWLLSRGLAYLSDELVFVASGSATLQGFTRPLNLKPPARSVLPAGLDARIFQYVPCRFSFAGLHPQHRAPDPNHFSHLSTRRQLFPAPFIPGQGRVGPDAVFAQRPESARPRLCRN